MFDYITRLLFEDLTLLLITEMIALAVVLAIHRQRMTPQSRRLVWVTLVVCGLLIVIQHLTITKREALVIMITDVAKAVDDGDVPAIADRLDEEFEFSHQDKEAFVADLYKRLERWQIDQASVGGFEIELAGDDAAVSLRGKCDWRSGDQVQYGVPSSWTLECIHRGTGWKVRKVTKAKVGPGGRLNLTDVWHY